MPNPEAIFATVSKYHVSSKLDCSKGFWQIAMHAKDKENIAFSCHSGYSNFDECNLVCSTTERPTDV